MSAFPPTKTTNPTSFASPLLSPAGSVSWDPTDVDVDRDPGFPIGDSDFVFPPDESSADEAESNAAVAPVVRDRANPAYFVAEPARSVGSRCPDVACTTGGHTSFRSPVCNTHRARQWRLDRAYFYGWPASFLIADGWTPSLSDVTDIQTAIAADEAAAGRAWHPFATPAAEFQAHHAGDGAKWRDARVGMLALLGRSGPYFP